MKKRLLSVCVVFALSFFPCGAQFGDRGAKMSVAEALLLADSVSSAINRWYFDRDAARSAGNVLRKLAAGDAAGRCGDRVGFADLINEQMLKITGDPLLRVSYYPVAAGVLETNQKNALPDSVLALQAAQRLKRASDDSFGLWGMEFFPGRIVYIRWDRFDGLVSESAPVYDSAFKWLAACNALVVDMRYNSGGDPDAVLRMQSYFVEDRLPMNHLVGAGGDTVKRHADPALTPYRVKAPVFVLTSGKTAGAAEDFIYSLRRLGRVEVIGDTTAGVTYAGRLSSLGQGFIVSVPRFRPVDTAGKNWLKIGIPPDYAVNPDEAMSKAMLVICSRLMAKAKTTAEREKLKSYLLQAKAGKYNGVAFVGLKNADARNALLIRDSVYGPTNVSTGPGAVNDFRIEGPYLNESNSAWFRLNFDCDTVLTFDIVPINEADDYDFALFKCDGADCLRRIASGALKPERLCHSGFTSYNGATGLSPYGSSEYVGSGPGHTYVQPVRVRRGDTYYLLVDYSNDYTNAGQLPRGFMIYFHDYWPEKKPVVLNKVFFGLNSAALTASSRVQLDKLVHELKRNKKMNIEIRGHTDNQGQEELNVQLSSARADAVRSYLLSRGVAADRVYSKGYGSAKPLSSNATEAGRSRNRRVEFAVIMK